MARPRPRKRSAPGIGWAGVIGVVLLLLALSCGGALAYFYLFAERQPVLDAQSLCPANGPQGVTVVLVDTSDELPETTRREVLGLLDEIATTLPPSISSMFASSISLGRAAGRYSPSVTPAMGRV